MEGKHFLQNNDVIGIGKYKLKYINDQVTQSTAADFEKTMVLRSPVKQAAPGVSKPAQPAGFTQTQTNVTKPAAAESAADRTGKLEAIQQATPAASAQVAVVQVLTGPNAGKELELIKNLTTLGKPGVQVAVLTRRPHGFFITHVEGASHPTVNGTPLSDQPHQLNDHDVIELAGVKMEFYYKG